MLSATEAFSNQAGVGVVLGLIETIKENRQYLSDLDGLIGDGDHGVNMNKGFQRCKEEVASSGALSDALQRLSSSLMELGGSMGPLYGMWFSALAREARPAEQIDAQVFRAMLTNAERKVVAIGQCSPGDKTLLDVLLPAREAYELALAERGRFAEALDALKDGAERGRSATEGMVAKKGRASRLGDRSRGVADPGATSCCLLLCRMADEMKRLLSP